MMGWNKSLIIFIMISFESGWKRDGLSLSSLFDDLQGMNVFLCLVSCLIPSQRLLDFHFILLELVLFGKEVMKRVWFSFFLCYSSLTSWICLHRHSFIIIIIPHSLSLYILWFPWCLRQTSNSRRGRDGWEWIRKKLTVSMRSWFEKRERERETVCVWSHVWSVEDDDDEGNEFVAKTASVCSGGGREGKENETQTSQLLSGVFKTRERSLTCIWPKVVSIEKHLCPVSACDSSWLLFCFKGRYTDDHSAKFTSSSLHSSSLYISRRQSRCSSQPGLFLDKNSKEVKREGERERGKEQCSLVTDHEEDKRKIVFIVRQMQF